MQVRTQDFGEGGGGQYYRVKREQKFCLPLEFFRPIIEKM